MIAEHIQTILSPVCSNVFQLNASQDDTMPFVIYNLSSEPVHTKDGICGYTSQLSVICTCDNIAQAVALGNSVVEAVGSATANPEITLTRFSSRETSSEIVEGVGLVYFEEIKFTLKHLNP
ncbi:MAG: hypothetical protein JXR39_11570 [Marinilabiliaceae bacterium]|nr:hypothetical protein [Marinilabiliaceae bacterium]